jgi:hypothetical protein
MKVMLVQKKGLGLWHDEFEIDQQLISIDDAKEAVDDWNEKCQDFEPKRIITREEIVIYPK